MNKIENVGFSRLETKKEFDINKKFHFNIIDLCMLSLIPTGITLIIGSLYNIYLPEKMISNMEILFNGITYIFITALYFTYFKIKKVIER